jgi:thymidine kinase
MTETKNTTSGYLELIIGPMFSGKTSKIIEVYKQCVFCNIPVCVINHIIDKRYHQNMLSSHDKIMIPCLQASELNELWTKDEILLEDKSTSQNQILRNSNVILINEGQFFPDLYEVVLDMINHKKTVYICGLDGDFEKKKFGQIIDLIPHCDSVTKLTSLCSLCKNGNRGIFSMRLSSEKEQTVVGSENYIPVCRDCYGSN